MRLFVQDLKQNKPFRVGLGYVLAGGSLLFAADIVLAAIGAPPWVLRLMLAALFTVFPFVVALAWALAAEPPEGQRIRPRPWEMGGR